MILRGRGVSPGVFEGWAHVLDSTGWIAAAALVPVRRGPEREMERFHAAQARACAQLERVQGQLSQIGRKHEALIFEAHLAVMRDSALLQRMERGIFEKELSAEAAVAWASSALHAEFEASSLPMVRDKAPDLLDIGHRLLRCLDPYAESPTNFDRPTLLVAASLRPSDLMRFAHRGPCAALLGECGPQSHTAILARSLGIPLVAGVASATERVPEGALVLLDGGEGLALVDPSGDELAVAQRMRGALAQAEVPPTPRSQPSTRDGVAIELALNISDPSEAPLVPQLGAAGIGLFRTEFLYMDRRDWPSEEENLAVYEQVAAAIGTGDLYIRLPDFGADKCPDYADFPVGRNPSLSLRGVRLLLEREDILIPQVRAIAKLAQTRPVVLLVPMLDGLDTLRRLVTRLERICQTGGRRFPFRLGAMIEVPGAALMASEILDEVDAVSIGLNDLTQYLMAVDREDESVRRYHEALQPALLRLVAQVVSAADAKRKAVSVCGELAGDPALTAVLLALGVRRLSISRSDYGRVAELAEGLSIAELGPLREELLRARSAEEVRGLVEAAGAA